MTHTPLSHAPPQDYGPICDRIVKNGEPGLAWLDNMREYGRMGDPPNNVDHRAMGGNPCLEQTLESYEMCCLVETFPYRYETHTRDTRETRERHERQGVEENDEQKREG